MNREARALPDVMITSAAPAFCFIFINNLDRSVVTGKSQTLASRIDLAIARSIRQGLSLRFSRNDLNLGYYVVNNIHEKITRF